MPMDKPSLFGTNKDGQPNEEYCCYCFKDGAFTDTYTMEQMVEFCLDYAKDTGMYTDRAKAKQQMMEWFPTLKRWSGQK